MKITLRTIGYSKIFLGISVAGIVSAVALEIGYSVVSTNCNKSSGEWAQYSCCMSVILEDGAPGIECNTGSLWLLTSTGSCSDQSCTNANPQVLICGNPTTDPNQPCAFTTQSLNCDGESVEILSNTNYNGYCTTVLAHN